MGSPARDVCLRALEAQAEVAPTIELVIRLVLLLASRILVVAEVERGRLAICDDCLALLHQPALGGFATVTANPGRLEGRPPHPEGGG